MIDFKGRGNNKAEKSGLSHTLIHPNKLLLATMKWTILVQIVLNTMMIQMQKYYG